MATLTSQIQQLYVAYFNRPADVGGLTYWEGVLSGTSATQATIANAFATTPEYKAWIAGKDNAQIIDDIYKNLFGRSADASGLTYWTLLLSQGKLSSQLAGLIISNAALGQPATSADNISVTSKITAAGNFTAEVSKSTEGILAYSGQAGNVAGSNFLLPVSTAATIPSAAATTAAVKNLIASNPGGGGGSQLELSTFQDVFTANQGVRLSIPGGSVVDAPAFRFSSSNQTVIATAGTVQANDQLIDPSTVDNDTISFVLGTSTTLNGVNQIVPGTGQITNIENLNFTFGSGASGTAAGVYTFAGVVTGARKVTATGSVAGVQIFAAFTNAGVTSFDGSGVTGDGTNVTGLNVSANSGTSGVTMAGGATNDTLSGSLFNDVISGGAGNDLIIDAVAGIGDNDTISGGVGSDVIALTIGSDRVIYLSNLEGYDTIGGFSANDSIALTTAGFAGAAAAGTDAVLGSAAFFSQTASSGANVVVDTEANLVATFNSASANRFFIQTDANPGRGIVDNTLIYDGDGNFTTTADQTFIASGLGLATATSFVFV